jgi:hypothetical protein
MFATGASRLCHLSVLQLAVSSNGEFDGRFTTRFCFNSGSRNIFTFRRTCADVSKPRRSGNRGCCRSWRRGRRRCRRNRHRRRRWRDGGGGDRGRRCRRRRHHHFGRRHETRRWRGQFGRRRRQVLRRRRRRLHLFDDLGFDRVLDDLDHLARQPGDQGIADDDVQQDDDAEADKVFAGFALLFSVVVCRCQNRTSRHPGCGCCLLALEFFALFRTLCALPRGPRRCFTPRRARLYRQRLRAPLGASP